MTQHTCVLVPFLLFPLSYCQLPERFKTKVPLANYFHLTKWASSLYLSFFLALLVCSCFVFFDCLSKALQVTSSLLERQLRGILCVLTPVPKVCATSVSRGLVALGLATRNQRFLEPQSSPLLEHEEAGMRKKAGAYGSSYPPYATKLRYDEGGVD